MSTYSVAHNFLDNKSANDIFIETNNKRIYELIIELLMVDTYMSDEGKSILSELDDSDKREFIFNYIIDRISESGDKAVSILNKIAKLDNDTPLVDRFKTCLYALNEYIKVGDKEVRDFGEIFTPLELVSEMLDTLPLDTWTNPNIKILDPCAGNGNFPLIAIKKLMLGLKDWEPDAEKRYKHIVENILYVVELQPKNAFMYLYMSDPLYKYDSNLYCGSFLDSEFGYHAKNVWGIDKFDIIMGNPPYNNTVDSLGRGTSVSKLPEQFMSVAMDFLKDGKFLLYVLPTNNVIKFFFDYKIHTLSTNSFKHFGGDKLAVKTIYFLIEKTSNINDVQEVEIIYQDGKSVETIIRGENFEKESFKNSDSVKRKIFYSGDKFPFIKDKTVKSDGYKLYDKLDMKGIHLKLRNKSVDRKHLGKKFILNFDSRMRYHCDYSGDIETSLPYIPCDNDTQLNNYKFLIESKLVNKISNNWGPKGFDVGRFFKNVSAIEIPNDYVIDDNYIYDSYNLSDIEVNFIENWD